ncbi:TYRO protein tyrosine kinase-binding protein-like [Heptranchias perlo]|uniref:TYRO protein tyrosine kinase-binding protein-like n=1 Tax=Heptranchias perlo TaxID=212740 RepID=UPI00355A846A
MEKTELPTILLLLSCLALGAVSGQNGCEECYRIDGGVIAGIVIGDLAITVMIAVTIYYFARRGARKSNSGSTLPVQMTKKAKADALETESPYEVLRGQEQGVYSTLKTNKK